MKPVSVTLLKKKNTKLNHKHTGVTIQNSHSKPPKDVPTLNKHIESQNILIKF